MLDSEVRKKLSNPVFMLRVFIETEEQSLRVAKYQLKKEHKSVMAEIAKLPLWHQPMDAPYWFRRYDEINRREKVLEKAKAKLRELEEQKVK